jgi:hypothetical protein
MGALLLAGCGEEDSAGNLVGHWQNIADDYTTNIRITANTVVYEGNYEAEIANEPNFEAEYGVIIVKFTKYWTSDYTNYPEVTTFEDAEKVGLYSALYWKELTDSTVMMADAYTGNNHEIVDGLQEALETFPNVAADAYVNWSYVSPYNKK